MPHSQLFQKIIVCGALAVALMAPLNGQAQTVAPKAAVPGAGAVSGAVPGAVVKPAGIYAFTVKSIDGQLVNLADQKGKVVLIVNVASRCGFTPQYEGLEALYKKYKDRGFVILGFPSNDFAHQEPGTNEEIKKFCKSKYDVSFPLFEKGAVLGSDKQPLYKYLTEQSGKEFEGFIKWNFTKFLIGRDGKVVARFGSSTKPDSAEVTQKVEELLK